MRAIPEKLAAAIAEGTIRRFILPSYKCDRSLETLTPSELQRMETAIVKAADHLRVTPVRDLAELVPAVFDDEAVVLASLRQGFFAGAPDAGAARDAVRRTVRFLAEGNQARFWNALERRLIAGQSEAAYELLGAWVSFHMGRQQYPADFGHKLLQLVRSLPPAVRRVKTAFPLLSMEDCIRLSHLAHKPDHEDVLFLHDAARGRNIAPGPVQPSAGNPVGASAGTDALAAVDAVLTEIGPRQLASKIGASIDAARAAYALDSVTVQSDVEFAEVIGSFQLHLWRHTGLVTGSVDHGAAASDALSLLERAFQTRGGYDVAFAEARDCTRGGLRFVLDAMADRYKLEKQADYVRLILKEAVDQRSWEEKVAFVKALWERLGPHLPVDITSMPVERFAKHYELIVQAYLRSCESLASLLRAL